jgi:hypothetical protein
VDVLHILEKSDEGVFLGGRRNDTSLGQHVLLAARLEFHLVHEVLDTGLVEDTIGVDEEHEQVVIALDVLGVDLVDELESPLLAMTLTAVGETGDGDTAATVDDIDGLGVRVEGERHTELLDGVQVQLVFLVSVEGEEDVQARRRVFAVDERVARTEENLGNFLVARHDNDDLGSRSLVENGLDPPAATDGVRHELIDTEQPWDRQETGERPKGEPLQKVDHLLGEVLDDLGRQWESHNHNWQKDGTGHVRQECNSRALSLPETEEEEAKEDGQNADTNRLCFLENLDNAVHECSHPQEPLEKGCKHDGTDDGDIDNLGKSVRYTRHHSRQSTYILHWPWVSDIGYAVVRAGNKARQLAPHHIELLR